MKLLKRDRKALESALEQLQTGYNFIMGENVAVMVKSNMQSNDVFKSDYYPNEKYSNIEKQIGSKLCFLTSGMSALNRLLNDGGVK